MKSDNEIMKNGPKFQWIIHNEFVSLKWSKGFQNQDQKKSFMWQNQKTQNKSNSVLFGKLYSVFLLWSKNIFKNNENQNQNHAVYPFFCFQTKEKKNFNKMCLSLRLLFRWAQKLCDTLFQILVHTVSDTVPCFMPPEASESQLDNRSLPKDKLEWLFLQSFFLFSL